MSKFFKKNVIDDAVLASFCKSLNDLYGSQLNKVILFGSRARGDARNTPDEYVSDYDIAIFLNALPDRWLELDRLADLRLKYLDQTGLFFDAKPYLSCAYQNTMPLMHEIRREGIEL